MTGSPRKRVAGRGGSDVSAKSPKPIIVGEWARNSRETIRVSLDEFRGRQTIDLRCWWRDDGGNLRPGKGGLTLGIRHLPALASSLGRACDQARAAGLLGADTIEKAADRLLDGQPGIMRTRGRFKDTGARPEQGYQGAVPKPKRRTKA